MHEYAFPNEIQIDGKFDNKVFNGNKGELHPVLKFLKINFRLDKNMYFAPNLQLTTFEHQLSSKCRK